MLRRFAERAMMIFTMGIEQMTPNEYQLLAARTLTVEPAGTYTTQEVYVAGVILSLCAQMSAVAELTKKMIFRKRGLSLSALFLQVATLKQMIGNSLRILEQPDYGDESLTGKEVAILQHALGAYGELGEAIHPLVNGYTDEVAEELGDLAWKLAALCTLHNLSLEDVMQANIAKLLVRRPPP